MHKIFSNLLELSWTRMPEAAPTVANYKEAIVGVSDIAMILILANLFFWLPAVYRKIRSYFK